MCAHDRGIRGVTAKVKNFRSAPYLQGEQILSWLFFISQVYSNLGRSLSPHLPHLPCALWPVKDNGLA